MAPFDSSQNMHVPLLQFIIALLLIKSKPSGISNQDFRKQMVSYIKKGLRSKRPTQSHAHIDTAAFWRDKSTGLEEENAALKANVSRLEARNAELEKKEIASKQKSAELEDSPRSQRLKRRKDGEPAEPSNRGAKRARTKVDAVALNEGDAVLQNTVLQKTASDWDELGNNLLDSLRNLQGSSIRRRGSSPGPKDLALNLISITTDISNYISAIDLPAKYQQLTSTSIPRSKAQVATHPQTKHEDIIEQRLLQIAQTFPHFLAHLHTLSQFTGGRNLCGQVIYRFIDVFRVILQRICDLAIADANLDHDRPRTTQKRAKARQKQYITSSFDGRPTTSPTIMELCKLLISMLFHLDPIRSTHRDILEGCLYRLLTRVGEVLKDFTIGGRPLGIDEQDTTSTQDPNLGGGQQLKISSAANDPEASEAQAPYLIWILKHAKGLTSSTCLPTSAVTISDDDHRQSEIAERTNPRSTFYDEARIRLQHTLVRALFGEQFAASFEPALEPPHVPPDEELMTDFDTQIETADVRDCFKNEVWRIVGWDVLRGNISRN